MGWALQRVSVQKLTLEKCVLHIYRPYGSITRGPLSRFVRGDILVFRLLPNHVLDLTRDNTETNRQFFSPALPKREQFDTELEPWKNECSEVPRAERKANFGSKYFSTVFSIY